MAAPDPISCRPRASFVRNIFRASPEFILPQDSIISLKKCKMVSVFT